MSLWYSLAMAQRPEEKPVKAGKSLIGADTGKDKDGKPIKSRKNKANFFLGAPTLSYSPETKAAVGVYGLYYFRFHKKDSLYRPCTVDMTVTYTQLKQSSIYPTWKFYFDENRRAVIGEAIFQNWSEFFFGIGNNTRKEDQQTFSFNLFRAETRAMQKVVSDLYIGGQYKFQNMYSVKLPGEGKLLDTMDIYGKNGSLASGLGPVFVFDSRDNILTPTKGAYMDANMVLYNSALGSRSNFAAYILDLRKYFLVHHAQLLNLNKLFHLKRINKNAVFAVQSYSNYVDGSETPFRMLALMGNNQIMRGFYQGRFRDHALTALQAEYRFPILWRVGAAAWAGTGQVAQNFGIMSLADFKYNYGIGARYTYNEKEGLNIRFDYGVGKGTSGIYFTVAEAF